MIKLNKKIFLNLFLGVAFLMVDVNVSCAEDMSHGGVTWRNYFEHAVNVKGPHAQLSAHGKTEGALEEFLHGPTPIAEADIRLNSRGILVMAHDLDDADSDRLTFKEWFKAIMTSNAPIDSIKYTDLFKKGVKLDIKENPTLNNELRLPFNAASRRVIAEMKELMADPKSGITKKTIAERFIIANADIVRGPGGTEPALTVVDMLQWRQEFPGIRISIGYEEGDGREAYSRYMLDTQFANAVTLGGNIDFNLRSVRIRPSLKLLQEQIKRTLNHPNVQSLSLTIWNAPSIGDPHTTQEDLNVFLNQLLPKTIPQGKKAVVLLDLHPAKE